MSAKQDKTAKTIDRNLPNKLTILRILLVPVFLVVLWLPMLTGGAVADFPARLAAAILFAFCSVTDFVDGKLARKYGLVSNFGKFMDPLADKFLIIGALLGAIPVYDRFELPLVICLIVIIFRELAVSSMRLVAKNAEGVVIAAAMPGKIKTFSQCIFVLLLLLEEYIFAFSAWMVACRPLTWACMAVMLFFTVYSGIQYLFTYKKFILD